VFPGAGEQRCWFHASGNVIECLPKRLRPRAKALLRGEIIEAHARVEACRPLEVFREEYGFKYPKALAKLDRDWKPLTALLRLRHRALAAPADHEPDRGQHRDRPAAVPA
jgi:transposase-like protein